MNFDWKHAFDLKREQVIGLDVGSHSVKLVQLKKSGSSYHVLSACITEIGSTPVDDERTKSFKTSSAIKTCLESCGIESKQAIASVSGPEVAVRPFAFPELPDEEIAQAVALEADQVCPFEASSNILDYQVLHSSKGGSRSGLLVAATNNVVSSKVNVITNADINCAMMDVDGLALANCFVETSGIKPETSIVILNIGHSITNLVIIHENSAPFIRDLTRGGKEILDQFAVNLNIPKSNTGKLLAESGQNSDHETVAAIEDASSKLFSEIGETLRYYSMEQRSVIESVHVCGGMAIIEPFVQILGSRLHVQAAAWNPFKSIDCETVSYRQLVEKKGPALAVAAGLAMRSI